MVALLLFYVTSDECAEEIVVIQTSTGNRNLPEKVLIFAA